MGKMPLGAGEAAASSRSWARLWCIAGVALVLGASATGVWGAIHYYRVAWHVPRLEIAETSLDLGNGKPGEVMCGAFMLRNTGRAPLNFTTQTSCGCQEVSPRKGTIRPGDELALSVSLRLAGYSNAEKTERVIIGSDDPRRPQLTCVVAARAPAPLQVVPAFIDFGRVVPDDVSQLAADVRVETAEGERRHLGVRLNGGTFLASREDAHVIRVRPAQSVVSGDHYDELELFLDGNAAEVIRVPVHLQIAAPLSTVPSTLILRRGDDGRFQPVEWIAMRTSHKSPPLGEISALDAPPELHVEEIDQIDERRKRYRLTVHGAWRAPPRFSLTLQESSSAQRCELTLVLSDR